MSLVERLQRGLDAQARALERRSPRVREARQGILECLGAMEAASAGESARLNAELRALFEERAAHNARAAEVAAKLGQARAELEAVDGSPEAQRLLLDQQELAEVDKQLEILAARRRELAAACAQAAAAVEARRAKWRKLGALEPPGEFPDAPAVDRAEQSLARADRELVATAEGRALWAQTCRALDELDAQLGASTLESDALPALTQTAGLIQHNLEYAQTKGWRPLETAIAHERKVLLEAIDAVKMWNK